MHETTREPHTPAPHPLLRALHAVSSPLLSRQVLLADRRVYATPDELGLVEQPLVARRSDGVSLHGAVYRDVTKANDDAAGARLVVFFPGNTGNLSAHLLYVQILARAGCIVAACDYAGYGKSHGDADLRTLLRDAHAILDATLAFPEIGCARTATRPGGSTRSARSRVGAFGVSLGSNIALALAAKRAEVDAVACEGLSRQRDFMRGVFRDGVSGPRRFEAITLDGEPLGDRERARMISRRLPAPLANGLAAIAEAAYPFEAKDPHAHTRGLRDTRVLLIHGTHDAVLPIEASLDVLASLPGEATFWPIAGVGHAQEPAFAVNDEYEARLRRFFANEDASPPRAEFVANASAPRIEVSAEIPTPRTALVTIVAGKTLRLEHVALEPDAIARIPAPDACALVAACWGDCAPLAQGAREALWSAKWRAIAAEIRTLIHESRLPAARDLFARLRDEPVEPPFEILLRLYEARVEDLHPKNRNEGFRWTFRERLGRHGGRR